MQCARISGRSYLTESFCIGDYWQARCLLNCKYMYHIVSADDYSGIPMTTFSVSESCLLKIGN